MTFGELMRANRGDRSLASVGAAIGRDHARMSRIERGLVRPTAWEVQGLVNELGLDAGEALRLAAEVEPPAATTEAA